MNTAVAYDLFEDAFSDAQDIPSGAKPIHLSGSEDRTVEMGSGNSVFILPVTKLSNEDHKITLRVPIPIYLEGDHGQFIAFHEESRIGGQGPDVPSAVRDFEDAFISIFLSYRESDAPLSSGARDYAEYLARLVDKIEAV